MPVILTLQKLGRKSHGVKLSTPLAAAESAAALVNAFLIGDDQPRHTPAEFLLTRRVSRIVWADRTRTFFVTVERVS